MKKNSKLLLASLPFILLFSCTKSNSSGIKEPSKNDDQTKETSDNGSEVNPNTVIELKKLHVTYENGDSVSSTLNLLYDSDLTDGSTKKLKATYNKSETNISFSSSDETVASVTNEGLITALKANANCKITISAGDESAIYDVKTYDKNNFFGISSGAVTNVVDKEIETLTLPTGPTKVNNDALVGLDRVKTLNITNGYTDIERKSSDYCLIPQNVEYISISSSFKKLSNEFWALPHIKQITVDTNNPYYGVYDNKFLYKKSDFRSGFILRAFNDFDGNVTDEMIDGTNGIIDSYGAYCFSGHPKNNDLILNPRLSINKYYSFCGSSFETISFPKSVLAGKTLEQVQDICRAFYFTGNLKEVKIFDNDNPSNYITTLDNVRIIDGSLYYNDTGNLILMLGSTNGLISQETKQINRFAFSGKEFVNKKVKIPNSVKKIYANSFIYSNLEKVYLPSLLTFIQETINYDDLTDYNNAASYIYFIMVKNGNLILSAGSTYDTETVKAMDSKFTCFFGSNKDMVIYDGSIYSRRGTNLITLKGNGYQRFEYHCDVTEEEFDTL